MSVVVMSVVFMLYVVVILIGNFVDLMLCV